jgi:putative transposase
MLRGVKVRLYPNDVQANNLNSLLGSCRFVYNHCLDFKIVNYQTDKINISFCDLSHYYHQDLRSEYEWLKEHNTKIIQQVIINLDSAYKNFFKQNKGFPILKSRQ